MYANLDGFEPRYEMLATGPDPAIASPLDRWMRALTQSLVGECRAALDSYDSPRLVRAVEAFVEDLSNWYVRALAAAVLEVGRRGRQAGRVRDALVRRSCSCCAAWRR